MPACDFHGLWASLGPVYCLNPRSEGLQISRVALSKVAKNGISDCGWVALGGSTHFCTVVISNIFAFVLAGTPGNIMHTFAILIDG